jgi:hypothetical protein
LDWRSVMKHLRGLPKPVTGLPLDNSGIILI